MSRRAARVGFGGGFEHRTFGKGNEIHIGVLRGDFVEGRLKLVDRPLRVLIVGAGDFCAEGGEVFGDGDFARVGLGIRIL